ncbi:hypothetical protein PUMCH_001465 [Australozyma saopauloensis]|uniref:Uncharacterized protein n=1 Tax=Australozyma saopauloensis TaxID=291208 RepID=A0AAX4H6Q5_9ASCO|nr:hypothetical protein PUMCH_001465 [[Candida] saopauloensis]
MGWERSIIYIWVQRDVPRDVQIRPEIWGKVDSFLLQDVAFSCFRIAGASFRLGRGGSWREMRTERDFLEFVACSGWGDLLVEIFHRVCPLGALIVLRCFPAAYMHDRVGSFEAKMEETAICGVSKSHENILQLGDLRNGYYKGQFGVSLSV